MAEAEERVNLDIDELLAGTDPNDYPGAVVTPTPTATPTATPPCFEAVFATFFAPQARKGLTLLKIQVSLVKLSFLKKGLCLDAEGTLNRKSSKGKNIKRFGGSFFYSPVIYF